MGRRGRKRRLGVEDEYWAMILAGVGTVEACRRVHRCECALVMALR